MTFKYFLLVGRSHSFAGLSLRICLIYWSKSLTLYYLGHSLMLWHAAWGSVKCLHKELAIESTISFTAPLHTLWFWRCLRVQYWVPMISNTLSAGFCGMDFWNYLTISWQMAQMGLIVEIYSLNDRARNARIVIKR